MHTYSFDIPNQHRLCHFDPRSHQKSPEVTGGQKEVKFDKCTRPNFWHAYPCDIIERSEVLFAERNEVMYAERSEVMFAERSEVMFEKVGSRFATNIYIYIYTSSKSASGRLSSLCSS